MSSSTERLNKPIFVVGSPRSGTSILSLCLGEHPSIFPIPESNWMGDLAINLGIYYLIGTARGNRSLLSAMDVRRDEFFADFGRSIHDLILKHRGDLDRRRMIEEVQKALKAQGLYSSEVTGELNADTTEAIRRYQISNHLKASGQVNVEIHRALKIKLLESTSKTRWVDATPEYSFYICALRKLFPTALFIHIVRDVASVVRSMLNFHRVCGINLVANEEEAYRYWLRTSTACLNAERAFGSKVVYRLRYADLVTSPESAMQSLLDFLGEPYTGKCIEPLAKRINSSDVPTDFIAEDPATDPAIVKYTNQFSTELQSHPQQHEPSPELAGKLEAEFRQRVEYFRGLDKKYSDAQQLIAKLQNEWQPVNTLALAGSS